MNLDSYETYLLAELDRIGREPPSPAAFKNAAVFLDALAHAATFPTNGKKQSKSDSVRFAQFVKLYMRPEYDQFTFGCGDQNLPYKLYRELRSGLVHSHSITPGAGGVAVVPVHDSIICPVSAVEWVEASLVAAYAATCGASIRVARHEG